MNKQLNFYIYRYAILCLTIFVMTSCEKSEEEFDEPAIYFLEGESFIWNDTTLLLGDTVHIGISAKTESNSPLTHIHYSIATDSAITDIDTGIYVEDIEFIRKVIKGISINEKWSFYVRDFDSRRSETITINLKLDTASKYGSIKRLESIKMGAQNQHEFGSYFSFTTDSVYTLNQAIEKQSLIDLIYFYDFLDGDENTIASPGANIDDSVFPEDSTLSEWTVKNTSRFTIADNITTEEFNKSDNDSLILHNTFEFNSGKRKAKNLAKNIIYSFVTEAGIRGLFMVTDISGTDAGDIEIEIITQKK